MTMLKTLRAAAAVALFAFAPTADAQLTMMGVGLGGKAAGGGALSCSYTPVTTGTQSVAYTGATPSASGGTPSYTFSETGTLPSGLSISSSTGVISGTPSASGSFPTIQVKVTDSTSTVANCGSAFTLVISPSGLSPPTIDANVIDSSGLFSANTTDTLSITTTKTQDLIIAITAVENTATPHLTVTSVAATGLTFTKRASLYCDSVAGTFGTTWNTLEIWSAVAATAGAYSVTSTISGAADTGTLALIAVNNNGTTPPIWSANASVPKLSSCTAAASAPSVTGVASNNPSLVLGFVMNADVVAQTVGSGFTPPGLGDQGQYPNGAIATAYASESKSQASTVSGLTVPFGTSWNTWQMIGDVVEAQ